MRRALFEDRIDRFGPVAREGLTPCWIWTGTQNRDGYGIFGDGRDGEKFAHRIMWTLENGPIPDGLWVLHHCDNPLCVNLEHLRLGTVLDNARDRESRGRGRRHGGEAHWSRQRPDRVAKGERAGHAKLTAEQVTAIRSAYRPGKTSMRSLARAFGVTTGAVRMILMNRTYVDTSVSPASTTGAHRGEHSSHARLREEQVREIRRRYRDGEVTQGRLAIEYGVARTTINHVITRKNWSHVE